MPDDEKNLTVEFMTDTEVTRVFEFTCNIEIAWNTEINLCTDSLWNIVYIDEAQLKNCKLINS